MVFGLPHEHKVEKHILFLFVVHSNSSMSEIVLSQTFSETINIIRIHFFMKKKEFQFTLLILMDKKEQQDGSYNIYKTFIHGFVLCIRYENCMYDIIINI